MRPPAEHWPPSWLLNTIALVVTVMAFGAFMGQMFIKGYDAPEMVYVLMSAVVAGVLGYNAKRAVARNGTD